MLDHLKDTYPLVYSHFSTIEGGEEHLRHILELDRYWQNLEQPVPNVVRDGSELPEHASVEKDFDLIYAGGTLGLLHAAVMVKRYGRRVLLVDRHIPAKSTRDWNISRNELNRLVDTGVFTAAEIDSVIVRRYKTGWVEFYLPDGAQRRLYMDNVLDCAVDADRLLGLAKEKVLSNPDSLILAETSFESCYKFPDSVVVQLRESNHAERFFRAKVMVDVMGVLSPVARQLNGGFPQTHVCPTVGTLASGFEDADYEVGEILASTEPAERGSGTGRQLIWEGFPARGSEYITYLFFYDRVDSPNDKSLLSLFETYFRKLPGYKKPGADFVIHRLVYGIIPAYFHDGFNRTREIADDRIILFGDAASLGSPLTFCGFGSMVRNLPRLTASLEEAIAADLLSKKHLEKISAYEPNVASMANLMKYMCFDERTDTPNFVNEMMNEVMIVLDELPQHYRQAMFRDEMKLEELMTVMLRVAWRYPKIITATWKKLGIGGSAGFLKNIAGWAISPSR